MSRDEPTLMSVVNNEKREKKNSRENDEYKKKAEQLTNVPCASAEKQSRSTMILYDAADVHGRRMMHRTMVYISINNKPRAQESPTARESGTGRRLGEVSHNVTIGRRSLRRAPARVPFSTVSWRIPISVTKLNAQRTNER